MKSAIITIVGQSPYSQSKHHETPKLAKELSDAYETRTWRARMHSNKDGFVEIPGPSIANCIKDAAKFLSISVPGKGKATFTKNFDAGVMVVDGITLPVKAEDVPGERLFVPSDGRQGGAKRVWKTFSRIDTWGGTCTVHIFDDTITEDVFRKVLCAAGEIIGLGRFRPRNRGYYGRFSVASIKWVGEEAILEAMVCA